MLRKLAAKPPPRRPRQQSEDGSQSPPAATAPPAAAPPQQEEQEQKQSTMVAMAAGDDAAATVEAAAAASCCRWPPGELAALAAAAAAAADFGGPDPPLAYDEPFSACDPAPGTGCTGFLPVPPNNYPFYTGDARYVPALQADGGQLSEWARGYAPSKEQADADRQAAYARGVPHGYVGKDAAPADGDAAPPLKLTVVSELHDASEYGADVSPDGRHSGGPFAVSVPAKARVEELRRLIAAKGGVLPGLQRLSYAGKRLDDAQRTLEHYGIAYWHARFPHWPLVIRKH